MKQKLFGQIQQKKKKINWPCYTFMVFELPKWRVTPFIAGHGIDRGDSTMAKMTADAFIYSAEYALAVGKTLGDEVIVMSNSFGGALSCYLASKHPEL